MVLDHRPEQQAVIGGSLVPYQPNIAVVIGEDTA